MPFDRGAHVHVASFGKGIVLEVRNGGRYLVEIKGRAMVVGEGQMTAIEEPKKRPSDSPSASAAHAQTLAHARSSIDLHGMTTEEAVHAVDLFLNEAMLGGLSEVQVIHGRSGGRLKSAVHQRLGAVPSVRGFGLDPRNPGVTIVLL